MDQSLQPRGTTADGSLSGGHGNGARGDFLESTDAATGEDAHDAEADVEEGERVGDEGAHAPHAADGAEHAGRAVGAPDDGETGEHVARQSVHREEDADERGEHQGQQTVSQHRGRAREGQAAR